MCKKDIKIKCLSYVSFCVRVVKESHLRCDGRMSAWVRSPPEAVLFLYIILPIWVNAFVSEWSKESHSSCDGRMSAWVQIPPKAFDLCS